MNQDGGEEIVRVRIPKGREMLGIVDNMLGANRVSVRCLDGKTRLGRIPGKMKKRIWIRNGDVVIVLPWEFQDDKADVIWRYTSPQVDWLERRGYLKGKA